jgi:hypothetical protein
MPRILRRILARVSRALNRISGGTPGETLCARVAHRYGHDCLFCRVVDRLTERDHCWRELVGKLTTTIKK